MKQKSGTDRKPRWDRGRRKGRKAALRLAGLALTAVFLLLLPVDGRSQNGRGTAVDGASMDQLEELYLERVRGVLQEEGYSDCGLTLTFERQAGGEREYTLAVHHRRLDRLDDGRRGEIAKRICAVPLGPGNRSGVRVSLV